MRILVTGGAGFVGSHLTERLLRKRHQVAVIDDLSIGRRKHVPAGVPLHQVDISDPVDDLFERFRPALVYHLAAQASLPRSVLDPRRDLRVNVDGAVNLMETAARWGVRRVVAISSAAVYGDPGQLPLTEESPTVPLSPPTGSPSSRRSGTFGCWGICEASPTLSLGRPTSTGHGRALRRKGRRFRLSSIASWPVRIR